MLVTVSASVIPVDCGGGVTDDEAAARLQQMADDTRMVIELPDAEIEDRWDSESPCRTGWFGQIGGTDAVAEIWYRGVDLDEAREVLNDVHRYWKRQAPRWSESDQHVYHDGINNPRRTDPTLYLDIDGYNMLLAFREGDSGTALRLSASGPCISE